MTRNTSIRPHVRKILNELWPKKNYRHYTKTIPDWPYHMPDMIYDSARPIWWEDNWYTYHVPERLLCGPAGSTCELIKIYIPYEETEPFRQKYTKLGLVSIWKLFRRLRKFLSEFHKPVIDGEIGAFKWS